MTKFIDDLKANGYVQGDLSTLPNDISEADRKKVEQYEADEANKQAKNITGQKPELYQHHVELNPNQYGFPPDANTDNSPSQQAKDVKRNSTKTETKPDNTDPLDHDADGRKGGHVDNLANTDKK